MHALLQAEKSDGQITTHAGYSVVINGQSRRAMGQLAETAHLPVAEIIIWR